MTYEELAEEFISIGGGYLVSDDDKDHSRIKTVSLPELSKWEYIVSDRDSLCNHVIFYMTDRTNFKEYLSTTNLPDPNLIVIPRDPHDKSVWIGWSVIEEYDPDDPGDYEILKEIHKGLWIKFNGEMPYWPRMVCGNPFCIDLWYTGYRSTRVSLHDLNVFNDDKFGRLPSPMRVLDEEEMIDIDDELAEEDKLEDDNTML